MICRYDLQNKKQIVLDIELAFVLTRLKWVLWSQLNFLNCTLMLSWFSFWPNEYTLWSLMSSWTLKSLTWVLCVAYQLYFCCSSISFVLLNIKRFFLLLISNPIFAAHQLYFWYSPGTNGNRNHSCGRAELWEVLHHAQRWVPHEMEGRWSSLYVFSSSQAWTCSALNISKNMFTKC